MRRGASSSALVEEVVVKFSPCLESSRRQVPQPPLPFHSAFPLQQTTWSLLTAGTAYPSHCGSVEAFAQRESSSERRLAAGRDSTLALANVGIPSDIWAIAAALGSAPSARESEFPRT